MALLSLILLIVIGFEMGWAYAAVGLLFWLIGGFTTHKAWSGTIRRNGYSYEWVKDSADNDKLLIRKMGKPTKGVAL